MSQENTNMSAPSRIGGRSPDCAGLIEWYDSPKVLLPPQPKISRRSVLLMKTRSAEELSPLRSSTNDMTTASDYDELWCPTSSKKDATQFEGDNSALGSFGSETTRSSTSLSTPHRSVRSTKIRMRRKPMRSDQCETEKKKSTPQDIMSMEEGLALGRASLEKLRKRLLSENDSKDISSSESDFSSPSSSLAMQCSPNLSPVCSMISARKTSEITITPSLVRTQASSKFSTSTPKRSSGVSATPLKRFRTMNDSPGQIEGNLVKTKIARTQSMNVMNDGSDDDSFLDDIFMPFTNPNQFSQMLKQGTDKK